MPNLSDATIVAPIEITAGDVHAHRGKRDQGTICKVDGFGVSRITPSLLGAVIAIPNKQVISWLEPFTRIKAFEGIASWMDSEIVKEPFLSEEAITRPQTYF